MGIGIKVPVKEAEKVKNELLASGVFYKGMKVKRGKDYVIFPLRREVDLGIGYELVEEDFESEHRKTFKDYLRGFLSDSDLQKVHRSFDIIGDLAIIMIPPELNEYERDIAESLAKAHKNIRGVFKKAGPIKGESRTRELIHLWGRESTVTLHREHGCLYKVDIARVYFSPRLAYERMRILEQVKNGEMIVDFFAGIGPFSVLIGKRRRVKVCAIDSNPAAYELLKENILLNKVVDRVIPILGDCREVSPEKADRVIMNLPMHSHEFLDLAFKVVKKGMIHFYTISAEENLYKSREKLVQEIADELGRNVHILNRRVVRNYSPRRYHIVLDIRVGQ